MARIKPEWVNYLFICLKSVKQIMLNMKKKNCVELQIKYYGFNKNNKSISKYLWFVAMSVCAIT